MDLTSHRKELSRQIAEAKKRGDQRGLGEKMKLMQMLTTRALLTISVPGQQKRRRILKERGRI